jgi:hypothetical protein
MTAPPDVASGGLTELAVRAQVDGAVTEILLDRIVGR